ncbi:hypothetical protein ScPMuIL_001567 [Solemya velum]
MRLFYVRFYDTRQSESGRAQCLTKKLQELSLKTSKGKQTGRNRERGRSSIGSDTSLITPRTRIEAFMAANKTEEPVTRNKKRTSAAIDNGNMRPPKRRSLRSGFVPLANSSFDNQTPRTIIENFMHKATEETPFFRPRNAISTSKSISLKNAEFSNEVLTGNLRNKRESMQSSRITSTPIAEETKIIRRTPGTGTPMKTPEIPDDRTLEFSPIHSVSSPLLKKGLSKRARQPSVWEFSQKMLSRRGRKDMVDVVPPSEHSDGENNVEKNADMIDMIDNASVKSMQRASLHQKSLSQMFPMLQTSNGTASQKEHALAQVRRSLPGTSLPTEKLSHKTRKSLPAPGVLLAHQSSTSVHLDRMSSTVKFPNKTRPDAGTLQKSLPRISVEEHQISQSSDKLLPDDETSSQKSQVISVQGGDRSTLTRTSSGNNKLISQELPDTSTHSERNTLSRRFSSKALQDYGIVSEDSPNISNHADRMSLSQGSSNKSIPAGKTVSEKTFHRSSHGNETSLLQKTLTSAVKSKSVQNPPVTQEQHMVSREPVQAKRPRTRTPVNPNSLPPAVVKQTFKHFCNMKVTKSAIEEVVKASEYFFNNVSRDLEAYARHANRRTIDEYDCELLMKRHKFITEKQSLFSLAEKYLPLELRQEIIPIARSGNRIEGL